MKNQGIYIALWKKYLPVIRLLLKKTDTADQTLELYKHELKKPGVTSTSYVFALKIINGKPALKTDVKPAAYDLMTVLNENELMREWLSNKSVIISLDSSFMLRMSKFEVEKPAVAE
ncbi:MAG: hypothetical protein V4658_05370 [Bacteroidota bacterium]